MNIIEQCQGYFDAWNAHDPAGVVATFANGGHYSDPGVQKLSGEAIAGYVGQLLSQFPDLAFEIVSLGAMSPELVAAEWMMTGTHVALQKEIALPGADFIRVTEDGIASVVGYFDGTTMQQQLGMATLTYPAEPQGPVSFGSVLKLAAESRQVPGAISVTWIESGSESDQQYVGDITQKIVEQTAQMPGFLGMMLPTINNRGYTLTAWKTVEDSRQLMRNEEHKSSMKWFFGEESRAIGMTSVWQLHHQRMMTRCSACHQVVDASSEEGHCKCGEPLPETPLFW